MIWRAALAAWLALGGATLAGPCVQSDGLRACFDAPRTAGLYGHSVLGATPEWGALSIRRGAGAAIEVTLPADRLFEDITPRLADIDGDGALDVLVVESAFDAGARLSAYRSDGSLLAATPAIGQRNRWLAPAGAGDIDGDGQTEIALIDRPHLARLLRIFRLKAGALVEVAQLGGLTNHRIGDAFIQGGLAPCGVMVLADARWRDVMHVRLRDGALSARAVGRYSGPSSLEPAAACR